MIRSHKLAQSRVSFAAREMKNYNPQIVLSPGTEIFAMPTEFYQLNRGTLGYPLDPV